MAIVLFILIAGLWAAFLLPSFFDHRNETPRSTTRDFARTRQLLATVSSSDPSSEAYVRRHVQRRRARILMGLGVAAFTTLVVATWTGATAWLWATIAIDVVIAGYVTVLLALKRQRMIPGASVVTITPSAPAQSRVAATPYEDFSESQTVRVIAG